MKHLLVNGLIAACVITFFSCNKNDDDAPEPSATINIASPLQNQVYHKGDTVHIIASINGEATLHGYEVAIVNAANSDSVFLIDNHTHAATLSVDEKWVDTFSSSADLMVHITTTINHDGLTATKSVAIKAAP